MGGQAAQPGLAQVVLGWDPGALAGDRRKQLAIAAWVAAWFCFATCLATLDTEMLAQPQTYFGAIGFSIGYGLAVAWREQARGAGVAAGIAAARVGGYWVLIIALRAVAALMEPFVPDEATWTVGALIATAGLAMLGTFLWVPERRKRLAIAGASAGLLLTFGSLIGLLIGGPAVIVTAVGFPAGLVLFGYAARAAR